MPEVAITSVNTGSFFAGGAAGLRERAVAASRRVAACDGREAARHGATSEIDPLDEGPDLLRRWPVAPGGPDLRRRGAGLRIPRPGGRAPEEVPHERAPAGLARRHVRRERGGAPVEPRTAAAGAMAGHALRRDDGPQVVVGHRAALLRRPVQHGRRRSQRLHHAVRRRALRILVTAHAALCRVVAHPQPRRGAHGETVGIEQLHLHRACSPGSAPGRSRRPRAAPRRGSSGAPGRSAVAGTPSITRSVFAVPSGSFSPRSWMSTSTVYSFPSASSARTTLERASGAGRGPTALAWIACHPFSANACSRAPVAGSKR